jgi:hypothetical protein
MAEGKRDSPNRIRDIAFRVAKATVKAILVYLLFILIAPLFTPLFEFVPGLLETIELFVAVYIVLMILSDLTSGTIFQHIFGMARALFTIAYLIFSLGDGVFNVGYESFSITLDLTLFYGVAALLSLLGLAGVILQAINFMNERAETGIKA